MPLISALSEAVQRNDHVGFLRTYMSMILEGDNLSVPGSLEAEKSKEAWTDVFQTLSIKFSEEFMTNLNRYWLSVVKKQGGKITETFSKEILDIIDNKAPAGKKLSMPPTNTASENPQADTVVLKISTDYYKHSLLHAERPAHKDDIDQKIMEALSKKQVDHFLKHYLSYTQVEIKPLVPLSTVLGVVSDRWEDIIMREYGVVPEPKFLSELSIRWFYLVNLKGIPINIEKLSELYLFIATSTQPKPKAEKKPPEKPKSFFKRLFGG